MQTSLAFKMNIIPEASINQLASVRLWKFKEVGSLKARFLQCGDQVSMISFDCLKWRSMGPQKLATIIGHKYSIFKPSKIIKVFF